MFALKGNFLKLNLKDRTSAYSIISLGCRYYTYITPLVMQRANMYVSPQVKRTWDRENLFK
jgi:hypothetical protein